MPPDGPTTLRQILSPHIALEESFEPLAGALLPEEQALLAGAVPGRRQEFLTGRLCARRALERLGHPARPILTGSMREPLWPAGIVGSITHCRGYCAAALAPATRVLALGIDAERNQPLPPDVLDMVASLPERQYLRQLGPELDLAWTCLLFSIKESIYKCWYPLAHCWLEFHQAEVRIHPNDRSFTATITHSAIPENFPRTVSGRYAYTPQHLFSVLELPHSPNRQDRPEP